MTRWRSDQTNLRTTRIREGDDAAEVDVDSAATEVVNGAAGDEVM